MLSITKKKIERIVITWQADNEVSSARGLRAALSYCKRYGYKPVAYGPTSPQGRARIEAERKI